MQYKYNSQQQKQNYPTKNLYESTTKYCQNIFSHEV